MKVKNIMGNQYSGTIGKSLTVCTRRGKQYIRKYSKPKDKKTPWQKEQRKKLADAVKAWRELSEEAKQAYNVRGKTMNLSGYNLFISEFIRERARRTVAIGS